jgi:hypothetical protein
MAKDALGSLSRAIRVTFSAERLDELPQARVSQPRASFLKLLLSREVLPEDAILSEKKPGLLSWLFRSEDLAVDPPPASSGRRSFLSTLLAGERLSEDPPQAPRARRGQGGHG